MLAVGAAESPASSARCVSPFSVFNKISMWGEFVSVIQHNLLRICHQQYFPYAHMVDIRFQSLLCCRQRKAFVNYRFQIGCQKGLHLLGQLQCLNQFLFTNPIWKEPAVKTQLLAPRNFCLNDNVLMRQTRIQQNCAVERRGRLQNCGKSSGMCATRAKAPN